MKKKIAGGLLSSLLCMSALTLCLGSCAEQTEDLKPTSSKNKDKEQEDQTANVQDGTTYAYGKITKLVGNEVTLDLAKEPEDISGGSEKGNGTSIPPGVGGETFGDSGSVEMGSGQGGEPGGLVMAFDGDERRMVGSIDENGNFIELDPSNMPKLELEYTGEQRVITIPAGIKIDALMQDNLKISDLKEGNVLSIVFDKNGKIQSIMVME